MQQQGVHPFKDKRSIVIGISGRRARVVAQNIFF
jgi:hypothetical protein